MGTFIIKRTGHKDIKITGDLLACVDRSYDEYVWIKYTLYKTESGKFVCQRIDTTCWKIRKTTHTVEIVDTEEDVINLFGKYELAKELYRRAGIDFYEEIE